MTAALTGSVDVNFLIEMGSEKSEKVNERYRAPCAYLLFFDKPL